ncbi:hypothetical protein [Streptomyces chiangmaiensis]|uniref:Uncharacterized protein n=1 Tax=Streptomyces chiangmaiensis TaxID=766497 RepID=A0ABU7FU28_9ACTN|nr:hypothetical protein [Streptomyces chiangmaiensis]MED7827431.1 hypothetical protein [Streptomyces chiangmaiensis]
MDDSLTPPDRSGDTDGTRIVVPLWRAPLGPGPAPIPGLAGDHRDSRAVSR